MDRLALQAKGIQFSYYDRATHEQLVAIERIDLDIPEGQFVSIVGPSGCGKSTLLKIINGLLPNYEGDVQVLESGKAGTTDAMVFQDAALFPWFNVLSNVAYGLRCRGIPSREANERAMAFIGMVGLGGFESKYPYQLSGGMQQRANLARALTVDPEILLMDEPFAALDAQTREVMQAELLRIWAEARKTVLFITHQIDEAIYLSDRVVVMSARPGRILADLPIDLPRPRELRIKRTPEFAALADQVWDLIAPQIKKDAQPVA
jgi:NitT/TauT family transport system ATP-binding protein